MQRVVPVEDICGSLWSGTHLRLSDDLSHHLVEYLHSTGLFDLAVDHSAGGGVAGGATEAEADQHLAHRFVTSAGRSLCAALDPLMSLAETSNSLISPFLGAKILVVDVPCGSGAAGLALIDTIKELRKSGVLPRLPIQVEVVAADNSEKAREHYAALHSASQAEFLGQMISTQLTLCHWDVSDPRENARLVDHLVHQSAEDKHVLVVASNFSDAMADPHLFDNFRHFLSQLFGRLANRATTVCWIEPKSNKAGKYLPALKKWLGSAVSWLGFAKSLEIVGCDYLMHTPVTDTQFRSAVQVLRLEMSELA